MFDFSALPLGVGRTYRCPCPRCRKSKKDKAFSITRREDGVILYHCFRCGLKGRISNKASAQCFRPPTTLTPSSSQEHETQHKRLSDFWLHFWNTECRPIRGTVAEQYLRARSCEIPTDDSHLRYHPKLKHPSGFCGPALVALVTDAISEEPLSLHRTWIRPDGTKENVEPSRLLLKGFPKRGGVIRLYHEVVSGLAIAEGIETALAVARFYKPVWSCIDAGNLARFQVPNIESIAIFADRDEAGIRAARECVERLLTELDSRIDVSVFVPDIDGHDYADVVKAYDAENKDLSFLAESPMFYARARAKNRRPKSG